jgi:hypothetical protein
VCSRASATSSLALRATAFGGFGLDLAAAHESGAAMTSTVRTAVLAIAEKEEEGACMIDRD